MESGIYDESVIQGDQDASSCYRVDHRARALARALGYCERWCVDVHSNCYVRHSYCVHVRHVRAHDA